MRNKRNFRGQSGRPPLGGNSRSFSTPLMCHCGYTYIDDMTGETRTGQWICRGSITAGVPNCSCCKRSRKEAFTDVSSALTAG